MFKNMLNKDVFDILEYQIKKNATKENIKKTFEEIKERIENIKQKENTKENNNVWAKVDDKIYVFTPGLTKDDLKILKFDDYITVNSKSNSIKIPIDLSNFKISNVKFNDGCLIITLFNVGEGVNIEIN